MYRMSIKKKVASHSTIRHQIPNGNLFSEIKPLLLVGKLLWLIPCNGFTWKTSKQFVFRKNSFPIAIALLMIIWYILKLLVSFKFLIQISHGGVVGYVHPAHYLIISGVITFIYIYCFLNSTQLCELFSSWEKAATKFNLKAFSLKKVTLIAIFPMVGPLIINTLFSIDAVEPLDGKVRLIPENKTNLEFAYEQLIQQWNAIFPYSPQFTIICLIDFVYGSLPRGFIFPLVISFSYALSRQYQELYENGTEEINCNNNEDKISEEEDNVYKSRESDENKKLFWNELAEKHDALTNLVLEFDSFLSPLIFVTYFTSVYLICVQLLRALSTATNEQHFQDGEGDLTLGLSPAIYNASFFLEAFLLYFMSISAAQLNDYAHKIGNVLRQCPKECQTSEIIRLENRVNFGPRIGFTGLGFFVITKPFLLTLANAMITIEIILLQAQLSHPFLKRGTT